MVLNLSQQTDSADLLGGFRPVQPAEAFRPLLDRFNLLFTATFTKGSNDAFLARTSKFSQRGKWQSLLQAFKSALMKVSPDSLLACSCTPTSLVRPQDSLIAD